MNEHCWRIRSLALFSLKTSFRHKNRSMKMNPIGKKTETVTVTIRALSRDEFGGKHVEKSEHHTSDMNTIKYFQKKLIGKGVLRLNRHSGNGLRLGKQSKSGHGGKYTWEGPAGKVENELDTVPPAMDDKDPNYVDEEDAEDDDGDVAELVVGEVEVPNDAE
ncbi:hypothetical protein LguiA_016015 [Lonicera macranthoides]